MAIFNGIIDDDLTIAVRSRQLVGIDDSSEYAYGTRATKVVPVTLLRPFQWDDTIPIEQHGVRQPTTYVGVLDSGNRDNQPRRYPLELSWRNPLRR